MWLLAPKPCLNPRLAPSSWSLTVGPFPLHFSSEPCLLKTVPCLVVLVQQLPRPCSLQLQLLSSDALASDFSLNASFLLTPLTCDYLGDYSHLGPSQISIS